MRLQRLQGQHSAHVGGARERQRRQMAHQCKPRHFLGKEHSFQKSDSSKSHLLVSYGFFLF